MVDDYSHNNAAWAHGTYGAWESRFGVPANACQTVRADPAKHLGTLSEHLLPCDGLAVLNIMGSHGMKALALAFLGAQVTVMDYSKDNARYAADLFTAAGVDCTYVVGNFLTHGFQSAFDIAVAEMGIVHYFDDISEFMDAVSRALSPGGRFVLRDFHPVSTKLLSFRGPTAKTRKYKVDGDYFSSETTEVSAPSEKHNADIDRSDRKTVRLRNWTLGEVVSSAAATPLIIRALIEEPNLSSAVFDRGIPKTYILVAEKPA